MGIALLKLVFGFMVFGNAASAVGIVSCAKIVQRPSEIQKNVLDLRSRRKIVEYLADTLESLEAMRGGNGLLSDTIAVRQNKAGEVTIRHISKNTSPTNIAVDLLIQAEMSFREAHSPQANAKLSQILTTLENLSFHSETGLFFSRYAADVSSKVKDRNVSSIDNLHLAIALWTIKEKFPQVEVGAQAKRLFERMNLSAFYDEKTGLIGGNLKFKRRVWSREAYNFANFGSEARALYSVGWALGLFKDFKQDSEFIKKAITSVKVEVARTGSGDVMRLWDGSAFQLFFPKMFLNEDLYSPILKAIFSSAAEHMLAEGIRRGISTPASHTAGRVAITLRAKKPVGKSIYRDKSGDRGTVSSDNNDLSDPNLDKYWDSTFFPNALFMAATTNPSKFLPIISKLESQGSELNRLYLPGFGWKDGLHVEGEEKGKAVPAQLSLNQGMIALSLFQMEAPDGLSLSSRTIFQNADLQQKLKKFYEMFDEKMRDEISKIVKH